MSTFSLRRRSAPLVSRTVGLLAFVLVLHPALAAAAAANATGAESPQAVVAGLKAAAESKDFPAMARLMAPEARAQMTVGLVVGVTMMVAFAQMGGEMAASLGEAFTDESDPDQQASVEDQQKKAEAVAAEMQTKLEAVFKKYGIGEAMDSAEDDEEGSTEALTRALAGVDQPALIGELLGIMESLGDVGAGENSPAPVGELENLKIDGDHATGTVNGEPAEFVKIDGRWYFSPPEGLL